MPDIEKLFNDLAKDLQEVNAPIKTHQQIQGTVNQYKQRAMQQKQEQKQEAE